jgi:asparagine synthase (glutamine-hydrolysing)
MASGFPIPPPDGSRSAGCAHAHATLGRWAVVARDAEAEPIWDANRRALFVGDVRLYNRRELLAELGLHGERAGCSDLEVAHQAFLRWGEECANHLIGDFAFVVWDEERRTAFAVRDHLGVRPLYYRKGPDAVLFASDVRQIVATQENPFALVEPVRVRDMLAEQISSTRLTFFRDIHRVLPGHTLSVSEGEIRETRYWLPPSDVATATYDENLEEIRALFRRSVLERIDSDRPIIAHCSGGFDSSTVIMSANEQYSSGVGRARLVLASGLVPGFASDESHYMDAITARVRFESVRWRIVDDTSPAFPGVFGAEPYLHRGPAGGPRRDLELAKRIEARVLLTGFLGDELWFASGILRDLARHGRALGVARTFLGQGLKRVSRRHLRELWLGLLPPATAVSLSNNLSESTSPPPEWWGPALREMGAGRPERPELPIRLWPSHVCCAVWAQLTHWRTTAITEGLSEYAVDAGVEVRSPHADVRLINHVLRMPWQQREPRGHYRRTGREALGYLLPPEFAGRIAQAPWTDVWIATARRILPSLAAFIFEGPWRSEPFVNRAMAKAMFQRSAAAGPDADVPDLDLVLRIAALEAWLRKLFG